MNKPMERGTPVDARRFNQWLGRFAGYRNPVTQRMIELWLQQFDPADQDLAARILDAVLFITTQNIHTNFRQLLSALHGWDRAKKNRKGRWFFVPFSGSVGESGDSMVHSFRMANSMTKKRYSELFIHRSELMTQNPGPDDTVVLVDDFAGTGKQACEAWEMFEELITGGPRIVLMLIAATETALNRIADETDMEPICATTLTTKDDVFRAECQCFNDAEKNAILNYCTKADPGRPRGWGNCGLLVVLAHQTPNNSIPILHASQNHWFGLFPRHD